MGTICGRSEDKANVKINKKESGKEKDNDNKGGDKFNNDDKNKEKDDEINKL